MDRPDNSQNMLKHFHRTTRKIWKIVVKIQQKDNSQLGIQTDEKMECGDKNMNKK